MTDRSGAPLPWWADTSTESTLTCSVCGDVLDGDDMDVPEPPQGPMCGACARAREFDETIWEQDLAEPDAGLW